MGRLSLTYGSRWEVEFTPFSICLSSNLRLAGRSLLRRIVSAEGSYS